MPAMNSSSLVLRIRAHGGTSGPSFVKRRRAFDMFRLALCCPSARTLSEMDPRPGNEQCSSSRS